MYPDWYHWTPKLRAGFQDPARPIKPLPMRKPKQQQILNTSKFLETFPELCLFYENIDFLTVRLGVSETLETLNWLVENSDIFPLDFWFKIQFFGLVAGSQLKVLHILDEQNNLIAYIHIKQPSTKKNRNFFSDIEFVGLFWVFYQEYFPYFLELFAIDPTKNKIVSRIDYCFDILGLTVADLIPYTKTKYKKSHIIRYGDTPTYTNTKVKRHELCLYDKKLDILEKNKHKLKDNSDKLPFRKYIRETSPITRIEFRKKSEAINELVDSSINWLLQYIRQQACDYFSSLYDLDFQVILHNLGCPLDRTDKPERIDTLVRWISAEKSGLYLKMAFAYAENYTMIKSEREYFIRLIQHYGERLTKVCTEHYLNNSFDPWHNNKNKW